MRSNMRLNNSGFKVVVTVLLTALGWSQALREGGILAPPASQRPPGLNGVGIEPHLNGQIPSGLVFRDESGNAVRLGDYFGKKPLILNLAYFNCQMLCPEVLSGLTVALRGLKFDVGREFYILTVSFDPRETPDMAREKKEQYVARYGRQGADLGWHFLTGQQDAIAALTKAAGFQYQYDPKTQQFAHTTAITVLTPQGKIAQYYYGLEYEPKDLRLSLVEASQGKIGNLVDAILLYCYHYDPTTGRYNALIFRLLRLTGLATVIFLGAFILLMLRRDGMHGVSAGGRTS